MKAFIPITLLALAGATSACTFAYRSVHSLDYNPLCEFDIFLEDDVHAPNERRGNASTLLGAFPIADCNKKNVCADAWNENLNAKYRLCINRSAGKDGKVDGGVTTQLMGATKSALVNIKPDGNEDVTDIQITYWRGGIGFPGAKAPKPKLAVPTPMGC